MPAAFNSEFFRKFVLPFAQEMWVISPAIILPGYDQASMLPSVAVLLSRKKAHTRNGLRIEFYHLPLDPKPPIPRSVASSPSASTARTSI
jgi:hypothetical protein